MRRTVGIDGRGLLMRRGSRPIKSRYLLAVVLEVEKMRRHEIRVAFFVKEHNWSFVGDAMRMSNVEFAVKDFEGKIFCQGREMGDERGFLYFWASGKPLALSKS